MCRQDASAFLRARTYRYPVNLSLLRLALGAAPLDMAERAALDAAERATAAALLPVFVCSLALPGQAAPLHVFEPRYRLLMRRAVEDSSRCFGMAPHTADEGGYPDVGTRMRIRSLDLLPDGRSLVDCVGEARFRVLERSTRDGYSVARVAPLVDTDAGRELEAVAAAAEGGGADYALVRAFVERLLAAIPPGARGTDWRVRAVGILRGEAGGSESATASGTATSAPLPVAPAPPLSLRSAAYVDTGLLALAQVLARQGRPPAAPAVDPQGWLWWVCAALPVGDARKYAWLAAPSWAARVSLVAETLRGFGPPLDFVEQIGAFVDSRGPDSCGVQ